GPEGRFSWDSESFYYYDHEYQSFVYPLRGQPTAEEARLPTTLSRHGFDPPWGNTAQLVCEVSPQQTFVLLERTIWRQAEGFESLWRLGQVELANLPQWFAWSDGQGAYWVSYQNGQIQYLADAWVTDGVLLREHKSGWQLFDPASGESGFRVRDRASLKLNDDRTLALANYAGYTDVLDLNRGQRLVRVQTPPLSQASELGPLSAPHMLVTRSRDRYRAPEDERWLSEPRLEDVHPREFKFLNKCEDGTIWLRGGEEMQPRPLAKGSYARFSPMGTYCLVLDRRGRKASLHLSETGATITEFADLDSLLRNDPNWLEPLTWITEKAIRCGEREVWRAHPALGWSLPQVFGAIAPPNSYRARACPIEVRREAEGLEFWHAGRGERLGILYVSGKDWFFLAEDGRLEASPGARLFKSNTTENALSRLVETDPPSCSGLLGSVLSRACHW
ncbi:MAG: hypothetical protein KC910_32950, partial [Candidatus Eremiobacteraeota bacterium]|nr:hypothetical protein [Candidatus Eremiobacteraeota bacterium]